MRIPESAPGPHFPPATSRREWLRQAGGGLGALALAWMLQEEAARAGAFAIDPADPLAPRPPHFAPKAERVIYLFMHGGPSHLETFDPKPDLQRLARPAAARELRPRGDPPEGRRTTPCSATKRTFRKCGQSGLEVSDFLPHLAELRRRPGGDPLVLGRQRQSPAGRLPDEHRLDPDGQAEPGELGRLRPGDREPRPAGVRRPARPGRRHQGRPAGLRRRLPAGELSGDGRSAAGPTRSSTSRPPTSMPRAEQRRILDLDRPTSTPATSTAAADDTDLAARIQSYELAYRMQSAAPEAVDLASRDRRDPAALRPGRPPDRRVRHPLPAGPPAGRAGCPVRPALLRRRQRLGRPRRRRDEPRRRCAAGPTGRSPGC